MGELTEKAKGLGNEIAGATKSGIGKALDKPDLQVEGEAQKLKGKAQSLKGDALGAVGDKV